jgi:hypothetical protein
MSGEVCETVFIPGKHCSVLQRTRERQAQTGRGRSALRDALLDGLQFDLRTMDSIGLTRRPETLWEGSKAGNRGATRSI